MPALTEVD